ncbi:hypothetical protein CYY_001824 [Polysphondylium violaceum]|uniref:Armadillo repeat-containing protein 1 n=1 Tax=Polysphondylium violaceum TaxID=133409 RepID=A0A8J4Q2C5_9MYCE|nr:hypothetical protein CYY_001824 [Polysphondylium violaceum]
MSAINVVQQLYTLSQNPDHREQIARDQGCLPALVMFLSGNDSDEELINLCLETLLLLASNENNRGLIQKEPCMISTLKKLIDTPQYKASINQILNLVDPKSQSDSTPATTTPTPNVNNNINNNKKATTFSMLIGEKLPIKDASIKPITNANRATAISNTDIKTFLFHVKGMNNESIKKQVEDALLKTKGVISFMIDLHTYQATIRTSLSSDEVKLVIRNNVGLSASLIVDGQEEVESTPDYLPEPNNPNAQTKKWGWGSIISFGQEQQKPTSNGKETWGWNSFSKALFG